MVNRRAWRVIPGVVLIAAGLVGCGAAQDAVDRGVQQAKEGAAQALSAATDEAIAGVVQSRLKQAGISLASTPTCTNTMDFDVVSVSGQGTATCTATTTDGKTATATFTGGLEADGCTGTLTIEVAGRAPIKDATLRGCGLGAIVGGVAEGTAE
jgi:hypothetical protein